MTAKQKDKLIRIIESDACIRGHYWDPKTAQMCIIGGMANASGYHISVISLPNASIDELTNLALHLEKHYGVPRNHLVQMQRINDDTFEVAHRRQCLKEYVDSLPIEDCECELCEA